MKFRFICTGLLSFFAISLALSQCVPVTLECPDDITITADPGDCGAFYNYTVQTNGDCNLVSLTQTDASGLTSGDEFPFGTTTQSYSTLDDDGNTDQCTFFVTVLEFPNPITDDACNGNVNISPDDDCEVLVTADMILEGGPYGCYDNYIVSITTTAGAPVPNPITADYIGQTLMASVQDPSGNSCWGYINYEDYIITDLVCQTYTIACGSPTIPSTDTLTGIPFPIPAGYLITPSSGTGPFIVEGYDNCGDIQLSYVDDIDELDCAIGVPFTRIINRNWTAVDGQGNSTTCTDIIQVEVSDISALNVFPDRDGTDAPSILCSGNWDANGDGIPQPDEIGDVLDMNCDVWGTYTDIIHQLQCGVLIDRDWQILNMCTGEHIDFIQQIKLEDDEPPVISCTPVLQGNAQNNCQATYTVPAPDLSDDCSEVTYTVSSSFGTPVNIGSAEYPQYVIYDVPLGTYSITYTAVDGCGNTAQCTSQLVVEDLTPPHINCESQYTVHLGTSDDEVTVEDLLVFYTDGCGIADKKLRRVVQGDCHGQNYDDTQWHDVETFCCEEAGETIIIEVGVWDIYGNLSTCIVNVVVNSNVAPSMTCPPDITISCSYAFDFQDLTVFGTVVQDPSLVQDIYIDDPDYVEYCKNKPYTGPMYWGRDGLAYSECDLEIREDVTINTECGKSIYENGMYLPAIRREFVITNESGEVNSCTQQIYIIDCNPQSTSVDWPADVVIDACLGGSTDPSETGFPTIAAGSCDDISADYVDTFQVGNGDTCQHIIRHWVATSTCSDSSDVIVGEHDQNIYIIKSTPLVFENCPDTIRNELQSTRQNLIVNGDFEQGPIGFSSQYEMGVLMAGRYIVTPNPGIFNNDHDCVDHTTGNGTGNLLMVDGSPNAGLWAWCQEIDVEMGQSYDVSAWVNNVVKTDRFYEDPNIDFVITTYDEVIMSSGDLLEIPDEWVELSATWIAPESITIELCARSNSSAFVGNDFALDDIAFIGMGTDCALNPDNGCEALIEVAAPTAYDCDTIVDVAWEVDLDYDGTFMADLSGTGSLPTYLPFGEHRIRWSASSMCGEQASCETVLLVEDCETPMAICEDIGIQILQDTSGITITAEQIAGMSMDNCGDVTAQFLVCEEVNQITENRLFGLADDTLFQIDYITGEILVKYGIDYPYDNLLGAMTYVDAEEAFYSIRRGVPLGQNPPSLFKLSKTGEILDEIIIQDYDGNVVHQIEALEYDESSGKMYTSVSLDADAALLTETLMEVNLATGELTYITEVRNLDVGSRDMDRFVVENGNLYYYDYVSDDNTYFFHVDLNSLTPPLTYSEFIFDLGDDYIPGELAVKGGLIYYQVDGDLVSVNPTNGFSNVIGQVHTPEEFNGNRIRGLAFADVVVDEPSASTDSCFFQNEFTIDCSDLEYLQDTFPYTIVVTDQYGLTDTCAGEIIVADSMNFCNPETCEFVYGVTTSGALYSINTADGAIEFVTNVSAPGNTNALGVNASLGLAYFGSEQTVYWVDIDDGSQGVVGDIGVPGSLSAAGASYRNGYYYMGPEIANSIVDIFRVQISADGKSFAGALENLTNGVVPIGNFGDFIVVDGTPGSESMIMSINNGANNDIYDYDVASNTFTLLHQIPAFSSSQIAMDNSGTIWYFDNGDITLGMLDLNTGIVSNSNPTPITFADLGRSYCPGSAFINLPGQVTHADFTRNRPNPFTEGTTIEFTVEKPQVVTLSIVSIDGRIIKQSKRHVYEGDNDWYISIDGPAGVYFYRIETADDVFTNSMLKSDRIGE